jgi:hypothetical protein
MLFHVYEDEEFQLFSQYVFIVIGQSVYAFNDKVLMRMYNTNGFRIETMYDYYIVMKSMFLVVKLSSHSSIVYVSITILLL